MTPRSSRNAVEMVDGVIKAWVTASPTDGQANEAVCRLVADALGLPPSAVIVKRGHKSRDKLLAIEGLDLAMVSTILENGS